MPEVEINKIYTLTNPLIGSSNALASTLDTDELIVETANLKASQQWFLTSTDAKNYYRLHTSQKNSSYSLDVRGYDGTDKQSLHFHDVTEAYDGQYWMIEEWSDGSAKLSNNYTGTNVLLDVEERDGEFIPLLSNLDQSKEGQHWTFEIVGSEKIQSTATGTSRPTSSSRPSSTSTANPEDGNGGKSLSIPAIAGIAAGGGVLFIFLVIMLLSWRKGWCCFNGRRDSGDEYDDKDARRAHAGLDN